MGIGGGIFLIALGAILTFALNADVEWVELDVVGVVLMVAGLAVLALTVWYWRGRRRRSASDISLVEETRIAHGHSPVDPESMDLQVRPPPQP
ncbi:MAG TPA: DUF6458 family protein [Pilimelia sp.]|nr:DUF6458 family protein [Pilimelia sp.]